jgi:hypothetical protein
MTTTHVRKSHVAIVIKNGLAIAFFKRRVYTSKVNILPGIPITIKIIINVNDGKNISNCLSLAFVITV